MGFYAPAQIVRDAREHGVEVRHPDVNRSGWDSGPESAGDSRAQAPALRLGLREVVGLTEDDGRAIERAQGRFGTIAELQRRAGLPVAALEKLAAADAFRSLGLDRRAALWQVKGLAKARPLPLFEAQGADEQGTELPVTLPDMPLSEHVVNDYQTIRMSLKGHPMGFLRGKCASEGVVDNIRLKAMTAGAFVSVAGVVLVRQRPGTAKGVVFITLEDEVGVCNIVVWRKVLDKYRAIVMGARLLLVRGRIERAGEIIHVVAGRIEDRTGWLSLLSEDLEPLSSSVARADEVVRPGHHRQPAARHPRQMRVIPRSRDFH
jgi:error-prone DNA polymerase